MPFFFAYIFPWFFISLGALATFTGIQNFKKAKASANWPRVAGKIISSSVKEDDDADGKTYRAKISYTYSVENVTRKGNRVSYGWDGSSASSFAKEIVARYPAGKTISVYYRPDNPKECVLRPGYQEGTWCFPIFGFIFFVFGCLMAVYFPGMMKF